MENARELLTGRFTHHFDHLKSTLESAGYQVSAEVHFLNRFGLAQKRERSLIIAAKTGYRLRTLQDLWSGYTVPVEATSVRRAISSLRPLAAGEADPNDPMHVSPRVESLSLARIHATPHDGGSWADLRASHDADLLLTPAMKRSIASGKLGSHPDVYGRMYWDRPAVTIKRECGHIGNGRYTHPEQDRLCSVREMALLQGFPSDYIFEGSLANKYRHIGDAVPPLVAFQIAWLADWILSGDRPSVDAIVLPNTTLQASDLRPIAPISLVG